jgi:hypothetical protein
MLSPTASASSDRSTIAAPSSTNPDDVEDSVNNQFRLFVGARMILD